MYSIYVVKVTDLYRTKKFVIEYFAEKEKANEHCKLLNEHLKSVRSAGQVHETNSFAASRYFVDTIMVNDGEDGYDGYRCKRSFQLWQVKIRIVTRLVISALPLAITGQESIDMLGVFKNDDTATIRLVSPCIEMAIVKATEMFEESKRKERVCDG